MKSHIKKTIAALSIATLAAGSTHAAITAFEAEIGTLGLDFDPAIADVDALGGFYITTETDGGGSTPGTEARTVSYSFDLAAGTYDLYAKVLVEGGSANDDSFYYATSFGDTDPVSGSWGQVNGAGAWVGGSYPGTTATGYGWGQVAGFTIISSGGTVQWEIGAREDGFRMDAFAFVTNGQSVTATELDNAVTGVPEPSAAVLISLAGLAMILRRRR